MPKMEQFSHSQSLKLPSWMTSKCYSKTSTVIKPGHSSASFLDIGQLGPDPHNRANCFRVKPKSLYKGLPFVLTNQRELNQVVNSTLEDTVQMQFMLDISVMVAYQHLLEKFIHLLTNVVVVHRNSYLKTHITT